MRIYVKISDKMGEKLDKYANDFGMSKSGFVAYALGSHINQLEHQTDMYLGIKEKMSDIIDDMSDKERSEYDETFSSSVYEREPEK